MIAPEFLKGAPAISPKYEYWATVTNVVDGDTFDATVDLGFHLSAKLRFRLARVDTAEKNSPDPAQQQLAKLAQLHLMSKILGKLVKIRTEKSDSFGRYLAEVEYMSPNGFVNLGDELLADGLAKLYVRGTP